MFGKDKIGRKMRWTEVILEKFCSNYRKKNKRQQTGVGETKEWNRNDAICPLLPDPKHCNTEFQTSWRLLAFSPLMWRWELKMGAAQQSQCCTDDFAEGEHQGWNHLWLLHRECHSSAPATWENGAITGVVLLPVNWNHWSAQPHKGNGELRLKAGVSETLWLYRRS